MCICQLNNKAQIDFSVAKEDLVFYKVVMVMGEKLLTPFRWSPVELNRKYAIAGQPSCHPNDTYWVRTSPLWADMDTFDEYFISRGISVVPVIQGDAYHLFKTMEDAERFIEKDRYNGESLKVLKAVVPKGSEYVDGLFIDEREDDEGHKYIDEYASIATKCVTYHEIENEED